MDPAPVPDFGDRYLENEKRFCKTTSKPCSEGQLLSLEINLWKRCSWPLTAELCVLTELAAEFAQVA